MPKYRDFSEMPADKLRSLADDLASPVAAMKRIDDARCRHNDMLTDRVKGLPRSPTMERTTTTQIRGVTKVTKGPGLENDRDCAKRYKHGNLALAQRANAVTLLFGARIV